MTLFLFRASIDCMADSAVDRHGDAIEIEEWDGPRATKVDEVFVRLRTPVDDPAASLPDRIHVPGDTFVVVRKDAWDMLCELSIDPHIKRVKAVLCDAKDQRPLSDDYHLIHSDYDWDVLDGRAETVRAPKSGVVVSVRRWLVDAAKVPEYDLFHASPDDWMATEALKWKCESAGLTGMRFIPVEVVPPDS
jgi:hypothetical protein